MMTGIADIRVHCYRGCLTAANNSGLDIVFQLTRGNGTVFWNVFLAHGCTWQEYPAPGYEPAGPLLASCRPLRASPQVPWTAVGVLPDGFREAVQPVVSIDGFLLVLLPVEP